MALGRGLQRLRPGPGARLAAVAEPAGRGDPTYGVGGTPLQTIEATNLNFYTDSWTRERTNYEADAYLQLLSTLYLGPRARAQPQLLPPLGRLPRLRDPGGPVRNRTPRARLGPLPAALTARRPTTRQRPRTHRTGDIAAAFQRAPSGLQLALQVPGNTRAHVSLPVPDGTTALYVDGRLQEVTTDGGYATLPELGAGCHAVAEDSADAMLDQLLLDTCSAEVIPTRAEGQLQAGCLGVARGG